jgi:hypothetical protein
MDRRDFFLFGLRRLRGGVSKGLPEAVRERLPQPHRDVSILAADAAAADHLARELLPEHFAPKFIRLRESALRGSYPGGALLFENHRWLNHHDDVGMLSAALRQIEDELLLRTPQTDPTLLRFVSATPVFSRTIDVLHDDRLLFSLPLQDDGEWTVNGALGPVTLRVHGNGLSIIASQCPHGICVAHPPIMAPGQRITCLPNRVTVVVGAFSS